MLGERMAGDVRFLEQRESGDTTAGKLVPLRIAYWMKLHFGDQMIEVRLEAGNEVRFSERSLVWAWGTLRMLPGDPSGHEPLYILENARTEPANKADIQKYFK